MTRRILAILVALTLAALGTVVVLGYVRSADERALANTTAVEVLVARQRIPAGTTGASIRAKGLVEPLRMPAGTLPEGETFISLPAELDPMVVTSDLQPGQLVLRRMFSPSTRTSGGLAIPEGKIAVSVEATVAEQVAGYVRPGSQVAVFVRYREIDASRGRSVGGAGGDDAVTGTAVLLPQVEVIAVGPYGDGGQTTTTPIEEPLDEDARESKTVLVTVAVDTIQAAKLIHAAGADALYLALLTDSSKVQAGEGVDSRTFLR